MKNTFVLICLLFIGYDTIAQYCGSSGYTSCTPDSSLPVPGITNFNSFPCITQGVLFSSSFQIYIPNSIAYGYFNIYIDSVHIDSITNLPCGLCWSSDTASQMINGLQRACINISGTTNDTAGMYPVNIYVTVYLAIGSSLHGFNLNNIWSNFAVFVIPPGGSCIHNVSSTPLLACGALQGCMAFPTIQQQNIGGCSPDSVILSVNAPFTSYLWTNTITGATYNTPTIKQPYLQGGYVSVSVVDSNQCSGSASVYLYKAGAIATPNICYFTSDTSLPYPNVTVSFERDNWSNNVSKYILIGQDGSFTTVNTVVDSLAPSSPGYFMDSINLHNAYSVEAVSTCGDTTQSLFAYVYSLLTVSDTGGYPLLSWTLQLPASYTSILVLGRPAGGTWTVKDTLYTISAFNQTLTYTDFYPDSSQMEYVLAYSINTNCDPYKDLTQKTVFTNIVKIQLATTSISNVSQPSPIRIYPNPAFDILNIKCTNDAAAIVSGIKVYDMLGNLLQDYTAGSTFTRINTSEYTKGVYLLKAFGQNGEVLANRKFIKE